jgi:TPR repeat protein
MARFEMSGAEMASMAGNQPTSDMLFELGIVHATGRDGRTDLVSAHKWFNLAAARGSHEAAQHRTEIALQMSRAEIAEAQRAAREWIQCH